MDDFLCLSSSFSKAKSLSLRVRNDFQSCDLLVNVWKSGVYPKQRLEHLGMIVDSVSNNFELPSARWDKFKTLVSRLLAVVKRERVLLRSVVAYVG